MSISHLGALAHAKPDEAKRLILDAVEVSGGDRQKAASVLGIASRSFYRFIEKLQLWPEIDALEKSKGFEPAMGPPRASERIKAALVLSKGNFDRAARALEITRYALRARIDELALWAEIDEMLAAQKLPKLVRDVPAVDP